VDPVHWIMVEILKVEVPVEVLAQVEAGLAAVAGSKVRLAVKARSNRSLFGDLELIRIFLQLGTQSIRNSPSVC